MVLVVMVASGLEASLALAPQADVVMSKTVNMVSVLPGQSPAPLYTVSFDNPNGSDVILKAVTDTLPAGFRFVDMHATSDWEFGPDDDVEPKLVWNGPITVPASSSLSLVYAVYVPEDVQPDFEPRVNSVEATTEEGGHMGPISVPLLVGKPELDVDKDVAPKRVLNGEPVVYTVVFDNSGQVTGTLEAITDTLDPGLEYTGMVVPGSDIVTDPNVDGGTLVWTGPFEVPPQDTLTLKYEVDTPVGPGWFYSNNRVEALTADEMVGPAETVVTVGPAQSFHYLPMLFDGFSYAHLSVQKSAFPTTVKLSEGDETTYTVIIRNEGGTTGQLTSVYDSLPQGFTFVDMVLPDSDIGSDPTGTMGTITWDLNPPIAMPPGQEVKLVYRQNVGQEEGDFGNSANVTAIGALVPQNPATAMVTVERGVLLQDDFNSGISQWTMFDNYWRLEEGQWYWGPGDGIGGSGALTHDCLISEKLAEDALMMYLGEGSENWTDYRVEVMLNLRGGITDIDDELVFIKEGGYPVGLWVRGQYQDVGDDDTAGWVTGYYIVVGGKPDKATYFVRLAQLQTLTDCWGNACSNPHNLYDFNNPHTLEEVKVDGHFLRDQYYPLVVEVRGANIQVSFNGELVINYTDDTEPFLTGTVGFKTFKSKTVSFDNVIVTPLQPTD
jgi:uncharacterized repeat protein (TIGR01451 family)